jgi:hypothetical protein
VSKHGFPGPDWVCKNDCAEVEDIREKLARIILERDAAIRAYENERDDAQKLNEQLTAANASIAKALALWYDEIQGMIRPDSDDLGQNRHDAKMLAKFVKLLGEEGEH